MFGFGRKKDTESASKKTNNKKSDDLSKMGIFMGVDNEDTGFEVDDSDLEDELDMILRGEDPPPPPSRKKPQVVAAKKPVPARPPRPSVARTSSLDKHPELAALGKTITDPIKEGIIPDFNNISDEDDDEDLDDSDLEAELLRTIQENEPTQPEPALHNLAPPFSSESTRKSPNLIDLSDDNGAPKESEKNTNLNDFDIISSLEERMNVYKKEIAKANSANNIRKARQMERIVKQYQDAISQTKRGKSIILSELPTPPGYSSFPEIPLENTTQAEAQPSSDEVQVQIALKISKEEEKTEITVVPAPDISVPLEPVPVVVLKQDPIITIPLPIIKINEEQLADILARQKQYKIAALNCKKQGDIEQAKRFLKVSNEFNTFIENVQSGKDVDMDKMPGPPEQVTTKEEPMEIVEETPLLPQAPQPQPVILVQSQSDGNGDLLLTTLQDRLNVYKSEVTKANDADNSRKVRQFGRIVKQYEEAISMYKRGKTIQFDELPTPPGFPPISISNPSAPEASHPQPQHLPSSSEQIKPSPLENTENKVSKPNIPPTSSSSDQSSSSKSPPQGIKPQSSVNRGEGKSGTKLTLQEKQLATIIERQKQFKLAALNAKKRGDTEQAKEFLKTSLGFNKLIDHSKMGLPVDLATLPSSPDAVADLEAETFELISASDCIQPTGTSAEIFSKLEEDLKSQMKMCMRTRDHFRTMGEVSSANRVESMALESKRDLDALRLAMRRGDELPKFHYENRIFSITECNSDLNENEIEINVIRGINYKVSNPDDVDTYVKIDFPYPSAEECQTNKSHVVKDTNNPEYSVSYKMSINKSDRKFQRFIHRNGVKFELWSKGGFLRGSSLIGTATMKLLTLETKCNLHEAIDIMEGRKAVGKLEVKIRLREPVLTKQITQRKEKWLSIDKT